MRKLKLQVQITIDGYICGPNGEMDWMTWGWDDSLKKFVSDLTEPVDCIILGRKLAAGFIPYWANVASNPEDPQYPFGKTMHATPKRVFSRTLETSEWENATLVKGELAAEIAKLKNSEGGDIIVYGGAEFVGSLISENLIDELNLFVNPTAISSGLKIFTGRTNLKLLRSRAFDCGIVINTYQPAASGH